MWYSWLTFYEEFRRRAWDAFHFSHRLRAIEHRMAQVNWPSDMQPENLGSAFDLDDMLPEVPEAIVGELPEWEVLWEQEFDDAYSYSARSFGTGSS